jgi:head-tail adaptor
MNTRAGLMRERLTIQRIDPQVSSLASLTRSGTTATATTAAAHGYATNDYVTIAGATPSGYNGKVKIVVTGALTFTYQVSAGLTTPATGTITATYASDAQGGRRVEWSTLYDRIAAQMLPIRTSERIHAKAVGSQTDYRFKVRSRPDLAPTQRALWTPSWPPASAEKTLEIHGVLPCDDGRVFQFLECGELR